MPNLAIRPQTACTIPHEPEAQRGMVAPIRAAIWESLAAANSSTSRDCFNDDRVHLPNEKFELEYLRMGTMSHAYLVDELLKM